MLVWRSSCEDVPAFSIQGSSVELCWVQHGSPQAWRSCASSTIAPRLSVIHNSNLTPLPLQGSSMPAVTLVADHTVPRIGSRHVAAEPWTVPSECVAAYSSPWLTLFEPQPDPDVRTESGSYACWPRLNPGMWMGRSRKSQTAGGPSQATETPIIFLHGRCGTCRSSRSRNHCCHFSNLIPPADCTASAR